MYSFLKILNRPIEDVLEPVHGAIYEFELSSMDSIGPCIRVRCNISHDGDEVWYTDRSGKEVTGKPLRQVCLEDSSFRNNDCPVIG